MSEGLLDIIEEKLPKLHCDSLKTMRIVPHSKQNRWILISKSNKNSCDLFPGLYNQFNLVPQIPQNQTLSTTSQNPQVSQGYIIPQSSQGTQNSAIFKQGLYVSSNPVNWKVEKNRDLLIKKMNSANLIIRVYRGYLARKIAFKLKKKKYAGILTEYVKYDNFRQHCIIAKLSKTIKIQALKKIIPFFKSLVLKRRILNRRIAKIKETKLWVINKLKSMFLRNQQMKKYLVLKKSLMIIQSRLKGMIARQKYNLAFSFSNKKN